MIVLDTHVLIWTSIDPRKLGRKAKGLIERFWSHGKVCVSAMTFWEAALLAERRKIELPAEAGEWRSQLLTAGLIELPVDGAIAVRSRELTGLPEDPVDRLIAASALHYHAALMTADERLLSWGHALERHDARA